MFRAPRRIRLNHNSIIVQKLKRFRSKPITRIMFQPIASLWFSRNGLIRNKKLKNVFTSEPIRARRKAIAIFNSPQNSHTHCITSEDNIEIRFAVKSWKKWFTRTERSESNVNFSPQCQLVISHSTSAVQLFQLLEQCLHEELEIAATWVSLLQKWHQINSG